MLAERPFLRRLLLLALSLTAAVAIFISGRNRDSSIRDTAPRQSRQLASPTPLSIPPPPPTPTPVLASSSSPHLLSLPVYAYHVAVDRTYVYWTQPGGDGEQLWRAPLATGAPELLAGAAGFAFALEGDTIYYVNRLEHEIHRLTLADGTDRVLARVTSEPLAIAVGGNYVYWTAWQRNVVQRVAVDGGAVASLRVGGAHDPIAADGEYLYVANNASGRLSRVAHGEAKPSTLASGLHEAFDLVVAGDSVYFTQGASLYRVPSTGDVPKRIGTAGGSHHLAAGPDAVYWTSWADEHITPNAGCDNLNLGVLRRVDLLDDSVEVVERSCSLRGSARSASTMILLNMDGLVARPQTCSDAAQSARDRELAYRLEGGEPQDEATAAAKQVADAFRARCTTDAWSQPAIDCYAFAREGQARACEALLSPAQRAQPGTIAESRRPD